MLNTKKGNKNEKTTVRKLQLHKGTGSYLLVMPRDFVREADLEESYLKISLLEDNRIVLKKVEI